MSTDDDPSDTSNRTVVRRPSGAANERTQVGSTSPRQAVQPDVVRKATAPTVISTRAEQATTPRRSEETVIISPSSPVGSEPEGIVAPTVIADRSASVEEAFLEPGRPVSLDELASAVAGMGSIGPNPIIAAATPILVLLGEIQQGRVAFTISGLRNRLAAEIRSFARTIEEAGVPPDDRRIATYALCETADDIVRALQDRDVRAWLQGGMLSTFFQTQSAGAGFFEALNGLLANPVGRRDLLEMMYACLCLGFMGQYRARGGAGLDEVRADVYATLRHIEPHPQPSSSLRLVSAAATGAGRRASIWLFAAVAPVLLAATYMIMLLVLGRQADALAEKLRQLNPPTSVTIERLALTPKQSEDDNLQWARARPAARFREEVRQASARP